jgi:hypothetical protein
MNYPQRFPTGAAAFWAAFPFQFDEPELMHLRHAYRSNIIMGGNPFGVGAALEAPDGFQAPLRDDSGLELALAVPGSFALGEPVTVAIRLSTTDTRGKRVHSYLSPNAGFVQLGIRKPSGQVVVYEPLLTHCVADEMLVLDANRPYIESRAYIGYGKGGHYFDQIGTYKIRALYFANDGSEVLSDALTVRVRAPHSAADDEIAEAYLGEDAGTLLYLLGSEAAELQHANAALDDMLAQHGGHPLAGYARVVRANSAAREFKIITATSRLEVRRPRLDEAYRLLAGGGDAVRPADAGESTALGAALRSCADVKVAAAAGHLAGGLVAMEAMRTAPAGAALPPHLVNFLQAQATEAAVELAGQRGGGGPGAGDGGAAPPGY